MYPELRRKEKKLEEKEMIEILQSASYGILSTIGEDQIPYGIPLNYCYNDHTIYFHCALEGHKLDNIKFCNKVSFCVVTDVETLPEQFNTKFKSVVLFGSVKEVEEEEKEAGLKLFLDKFSNEFQEEGMKYIKQAQKKVKLFKIDIDHMTGKGKK